MKKTTLIPALAVSLLLTSCSLNDDPNGTSSSESVTIYTTNIVTPLNTDGVSVATEGSYSFNLNYTQHVVTISANGINTGSGALTSFKATDIPLKTRLENCVEHSFHVATLASGSESINDLQGYITSNFYWLNSSVIAAPILPYDQNPRLRLLLDYKINDEYEVNTVPSDMLYIGTTETTTNELEAPFVTKDGAFRIVPNFKTKKAAVIFYNMQFSDKMPVKLTFMLKDLDIEMTHGGFKVVGTDVAPEMPNGVVAEQFMFKNFKALAGGRFLNQLTMQYKVGDSYSGAFTGEFAYILK